MYIQLIMSLPLRGGRSLTYVDQIMPIDHLPTLPSVDIGELTNLLF